MLRFPSASLGFGLSFLLVSDPGAQAAPAAPETAPVAGARVLANVPNRSLHALPGNRILVLDMQGIRILAPDGRSGPLVPRAYQYIHAPIVADPQGYLIAGLLDTKPRKEEVILIDTAGREVLRWELPALMPFLSLSVSDRGRWAATSRGWLPLLADGKLGTPVPYPKGNSRKGRFVTQVIVDGSDTIVCRDRAHGKPFLSSCEKTGPNGWSFAVDDIAGKPLVCGPWAIFRKGSNPEWLMIYSLRTGEPVRNNVPLKRNGSYLPLVACSDSQAVAIGGRELELRRLPSLERIWVKPLPPRGHTPNLIVLQKEIAFGWRGNEWKGIDNIYFVPRDD